MTEASIAPDISNSLALLMQYNVEAYKTFQKFAENLPNPMTAAMFKGLASDERNIRDLLELKYLASGAQKIELTLGNDLRFQDLLEGDLAYRESTEMLLVRERTMEQKLHGMARTAAFEDRNLFAYIAATKKAHVALLERELQLLRMYPDWFKREDAEDLIVHGKGR